MMVKVCGITRREDAIAAAEAGASAIGFIFYPNSPRYVTPDRARELGEGLDVWKVGVFVNETAASIEATMRAANLDVAQIYGSESPSARIWRAIRIEGGPPPYGGRLDPLQAATRERAGPAPDEALFLDGSANGVSFDWDRARPIAEQLKVVIAGGLNPTNVAEAIRIAKPWGVDASSGLEISPGIKDHQKVRQFVKAAQEAAS